MTDKIQRIANLYYNVIEDQQQAGEKLEILERQELMLTKELEKEGYTIENGEIFKVLKTKLGPTSTAKK